MYRGNGGIRKIEEGWGQIMPRRGVAALRRGIRLRDKIRDSGIGLQASGSVAARE